MVAPTEAAAFRNGPAIVLGNLKAWTTGGWSLLNPISGPGVFDRLCRLFRRMRTNGDGESFIVEDATGFAAQELVHREANPAGLIHLQSKRLVKRILDRICGAFDHRNAKTLSGKFHLSNSFYALPERTTNSTTPAARAKDLHGKAEAISREPETKESLQRPHQLRSLDR